MRITGGTLRGRRVIVPASRVRPTTEMAREALFSIMQERVGGSRFLDLFAGSGAVGLEAWSRGASEVAWVESNRHVLRVLSQNVEQLLGKKGAVFYCDALKFPKKGLETGKFDIIFADPPYEKEEDRGIAALILASVREKGLLNPGGVCVIETICRNDADHFAGWELLKERKYGDARIRFFVQSSAVDTAEGIKND